MPWQTYPPRAGAVECWAESAGRRSPTGFRPIRKYSFSLRRELPDLDQLETQLLQLREQLVQAVLVSHRSPQHRLDRLDLGGEAELVREVLTHPTTYADLVVERHRRSGIVTGERVSARPPGGMSRAHPRGEGPRPPPPPRSVPACMEPTVVCAIDPDSGDRGPVELARVAAVLL